MGDNYLEGQAGNTRRRRDLAGAFLAAPTLLERPEILTRVFSIKPLPNCSPSSGEILLVIRDEAQQRPAVLKGNDKIGHVVGEGAELLMEILSQPATGTVAELRVMDVSHLSGVAHGCLYKQHYKQHE